MTKVITFSRTFPAYHPRKGELTNFVEKLWASKHADYEYKVVSKALGLVDVSKEFEPKHHTIRSGNRWKAGDKFSPRVWSGRPYNSKMVRIGPDIEIKKVWGFESTGNGHLYINDKSIDVLEIEALAKNDGLSNEDLLKWFKYPKPFKGQIICWSDKVEY